IFGLSLMIFPQTIATFLVSVNNDTVSTAAQFVENLYANPFFYDITYFLLVFGFTFFYTTLIFEPNRIADNLQKQGGFIPGIRPGEQTERYLQYLSRRIVFIGATSLGLIAVLPRVLDDITTTDLNITIGGTALLIVVSVVLETMRQIESQIIVRDYDSLR
ncbi:MAG: preprotein translocase subunit SecY, partial [Candidatus Paceibacteria bacterium]